MSKLLPIVWEWMVNSRNFQKFGGWLGICLATMEFMRLHHAWVKMTRAEFGITDAEWQSWTQYVIALTLCVGSITLTKAAKRKEESQLSRTGPVGGSET